MDISWAERDRESDNKNQEIIMFKNSLFQNICFAMQKFTLCINNRHIIPAGSKNQVDKNLKDVKDVETWTNWIVEQSIKQLSKTLVFFYK